VLFNVLLCLKPIPTFASRPKYDSQLVKMENGEQPATLAEALDILLPLLKRSGFSYYARVLVVHNTCYGEEFGYLIAPSFSKLDEYIALFANGRWKESTAENMKELVLDDVECEMCRLEYRPLRISWTYWRPSALAILKDLAGEVPSCAGG